MPNTRNRDPRSFQKAEVGELVPEENAATKRECAGVRGLRCQSPAEISFPNSKPKTERTEDFDLDAANKRFEKLEKDETPAGRETAVVTVLRFGSGFAGRPTLRPLITAPEVELYQSLEFLSSR